MSLFFCLIEPCPPIDLGIILDSSGSLNFGENEENIQEFAKALIDKFDVKPGEDGTHVSIVQFDDEPKLLLGFNDLQTKSNVRDKIDSYKISVGGTTSLDKAIDMENNQYTSQAGMRGPKILKVRIPSCLQICISRLRSVADLQSWTKVLGQITFVALFQTRQTSSHARIHLHLVSSSPQPPPTMLDTCTRYSPEFFFLHWEGGGGNKATQFKTDNSAFLKLRFENIEN